VSEFNREVQETTPLHAPHTRRWSGCTCRWSRLLLPALRGVGVRACNKWVYEHELTSQELRRLELSNSPNGASLNS